jgi:micrococcal nuclease
MSKKKIGLLVVGAGIIVGAVMSGGTDPATTTAAVEPSTSPIATQAPTSPSPSVVPSVSPSPSTTASAPTGIVTEVVDGDTIRVELPTGAETVRIIGIGTPEVVHPSQPEACFGVEATAYAKNALNGQTVTLETDPTQDERDTYDRLLAHVYVGDELYAESAIAGGYGIHYIYEAPSSHADELDAAAAAAKADGRGIWASCEGRVDLPKVAPVPAATPAATAKPTPKPDATPKSDCHPSYDPCVPNVGHDLDCGDIGFHVAVVGPDEHRLDGSDNDGLGCESY